MDDKSNGEGHSRLRRLLQLCALAVVAGLIALLVHATLDRGAGRELVSQVEAGSMPRAPHFNLGIVWDHAEAWPPELRAALADEAISLRELRGWPVVLNFWASWCLPCKAEAPRLKAAAQEASGKVVFLGIDVQDFESDARGFLERYDTNYVSIRDGGHSTYSAYGLTGLPETYFVDASGRVAAHVVGELSARDLNVGISQAVGQ
jgi:cytochrome c biogenesis protein CcmG, thiol:disulfide interchange protein DsbE